MKARKALTLLGFHQRRCFGFLELPDGLNLPYQFKNQATLAFSTESKDPKIFDTMSRFLSSNHNNIRDGFIFAYTVLLKAVAELDYDTIDSGCEFTLYRGFADGLDQVRSKGL